MDLKHYRDNVVARTDHDGIGRCTVTWVENGKETDITCDGWIAGEVLFVPADGDCNHRDENFDADGMPAEAANWYRVDTGEPAIVGYPATHGLAVLEIRYPFAIPNY
jgi:hypothetical protein